MIKDRAALIAKLEERALSLTDQELDIVLAALRDGPAEAQPRQSPRQRAEAALCVLVHETGTATVNLSGITLADVRIDLAQRIADAIADAEEQLQAELQRLREENEALQSARDICTCGHYREGHHIWGRCHGLRCKCTAFVLGQAWNDQLAKKEQAEAEVITLKDELSQCEFCDHIFRQPVLGRGRVVGCAKCWNDQAAEVVTLKAENAKLKRSEADNHHNAATCPYCMPQLEEQRAEVVTLRAQLAASVSLAELEALSQRWHDPDYWKEEGCLFDSTDCANQLDALIAAHRPKE